MPSFSFKALDREGREISGAIEAAHEAQAYGLLQDRGLAAVAIKLVRPIASRAAGSVRGKPLVRAMRQLATLLSAGVPLVDAIESLSRSQANGGVAAGAAGIKKALRAGGRFSAALEAEFVGLPAYVIRLAELGETTGQLGAALVEAADLLEYEARAASEVRSALTYPLFLLVTGTLIVFGMFVFVVPRFAQLIDGSNADVPAISRAVISFSLWFNTNWPLFVTGVAGIAVVGFLVGRQGRLGGASLLESIPLLRRLQSSRDIASWARTLGGALKHGAELLPALELAERVVRSASTRRGLAAARMAVRAGRALDEALVDNVGLIDRMMIDMIRTGRSSGKLSAMLLHAASVFEEERRERTKRITAIAEPLAVVLIAAVVGTIVSEHRSGYDEYVRGGPMRSMRRARAVMPDARKCRDQPGRRRRFVSDGGFSLIEMLVVLAIMAMLVALVAPRLFSQVDRSKQTVAETETKSLESSLETMRLDLGKYPSESEGLELLVRPPSDPSLQDRWFGPYLKDGVPKDPWGNPYRYDPPVSDARGFAKAPRVYSYGEDNKPGGEGTNKDIGRAADTSSGEEAGSAEP